MKELVILIEKYNEIFNNKSIGTLSVINTGYEFELQVIKNASISVLHIAKTKEAIMSFLSGLQMGLFYKHEPTTKELINDGYLVNLDMNLSKTFKGKDYEKEF